MDLSLMILEEADKQFNKKCILNKCDIQICMYNIYNYKFTITILANDIRVKYKELVYKIPKSDTASYKKIIYFLLTHITDNANNILHYDIENTDLFIESENEINTFKLSKNEKIIYEIKSSIKCEFNDVVWNYLENLRFLSVM